MAGETAIGDDPVLALPGAERARTPQESWDLLEPRLGDYGITRVARLTGLDSLGLPVWTAVRPAATTLSTSQGKGITDLLAKVSAVAEAIELWHVEQPPPVFARGPAREIAPDCPLAALPLRRDLPGQVLAGVVWDWMAGVGLCDGQAVLLPVDLVRRRTARPAWTPDLLRATSTGLACGSSREEALLHALYEVVERDVLHRDTLTRAAARTPVDLNTVPAGPGREVLDLIAAARFSVEASAVTGPYRLPVVLACLWSEDHPALFAGAGCHGDPQIALTRALTEAAQSRLTVLAGTRDDLPGDYGPLDAPTRPTPPAVPGARVDWARAIGGCDPPRGGFAARVGEVAERVRAVTGHQPVALDLTLPGEPVHTVQVICPGTRSRVTRTVPR
ncbi:MULTISPECIES: YcaO-like family protein [Actinosynnema]|uniref:YcaO-like family protein n=1 Tax=Actinosynnema TaxID=40566 RepID=UPI0020A38CB3|nr:YcaO-like family protein [Actinosynnema pretiosum]MCP2097281.1 ribosomal protein S12 methylthiotransferase accessory factor [Actinosynnema pretiosum]